MCITVQFVDPHKTTYLEVNSSLIGIRWALLQNAEEKENKQGQYLDINADVHKIPDSIHFETICICQQIINWY